MKWYTAERYTQDRQRPVRAADVHLLRADDEIRTRDPHLGKEMKLERRERSCPLSSLSPVCSSAQTVESAPLRLLTFNALNLYQILQRPVATPNVMLTRAASRYHSGMEQVTYAVRDNRAEWAGRLLRDWVPDLVAAIVDKFDPAKILLFGSVSDGTDGPDSDIDLLVILDHAPLNDRRHLMVDLRHTSRHIAAPHDLLVTSVDDFEQNQNSPGTTEFEPAHHCIVVYERPAT